MEYSPKKMQNVLDNNNFHFKKNTKGDIKTYELKEIVQKDEKDIQIEYLQAQIEELKKGMNKDESNADANESTSNTAEE